LSFAGGVPDRDFYIQGMTVGAPGGKDLPFANGRIFPAVMWAGSQPFARSFARVGLVPRLCASSRRLPGWLEKCESRRSEILQPPPDIFTLAGRRAGRFLVLVLLMRWSNTFRSCIVGSISALSVRSSPAVGAIAATVLFALSIPEITTTIGRFYMVALIFLSAVWHPGAVLLAIHDPLRPFTVDGAPAAPAVPAFSFMFWGGAVVFPR